MNSQRNNPNAAKDRSSGSVAEGWRALWGVPLGLAAQVGAMETVIAVAPRTAEGVRQCVDVPWLAYAMAPQLTACLASYLTCLALVRNSRLRIMLFVVACGTILLAAPTIIGLLRRDFIGKL